jgi:hypothetical protein
MGIPDFTQIELQNFVIRNSRFTSDMLEQRGIPAFTEIKLPNLHENKAFLQILKNTKLSLNLLVFKKSNLTNVTLILKNM